MKYGKRWMTVAQVAKLVGYGEGKIAAQRLLRRIRAAEATSGEKVLHRDANRPLRPRIILTLAGVRRVCPELFVDADSLPFAVREQIEDVVKLIQKKCSRDNVHERLISELLASVEALREEQKAVRALLQNAQ